MCYRDGCPFRREQGVYWLQSLGPSIHCFHFIRKLPKVCSEIIGMIWEGTANQTFFVSFGLLDLV